jgi:hypothetical protein
MLPMTWKFLAVLSAFHLISADVAMGQPSAFVGCYTLTVGTWHPELSGAAPYHRVPTTVRLDTTSRGPGWVLSPDIPYPRPSRFPTTPRWQVKADTLVLTWSNGYSPTVIHLLSKGAALEGEAVALGDAHPIPEPPRPRARVIAQRQQCAS